MTPAILVCMVVGVVIGEFVPNVQRAFDGVQFRGVSVRTYSQISEYVPYADLNTYAAIAVGLASAVVPLYQSEITAPAIRGRLVSMQQWSITWGIFLQYFVEFGCSYINGTASFRIPWGLQMIPAIILSLGMMVFPEVRSLLLILVMCAWNLRKFRCCF